MSKWYQLSKPSPQTEIDFQVATVEYRRVVAQIMEQASVSKARASDLLKTLESTLATLERAEKNGHYKNGSEE